MAKLSTPNALNNDIDEEMHEIDEDAGSFGQLDSDVELEDEMGHEDEEEGDDDEDEDDYDEDEVSDSSMDGGIAVPKGRAISPSAIPFSTHETDMDTTIPAPSSVTTADAMSTAPGLLNPEKPTPYVPDAGNLLITDPNPLTIPQNANPAAVEAALSATARDAAQSLLNHLLTTCPIHSTSVTVASTSGITMSLPPPTYQLPREKRIPKPKPPTRWEQFAARKGIGNKKKGGIGRSRTDADGNLLSTEGKKVYDEATGEWVNKWGYKGKNKKGEGDWLVEVDMKKEKREQEPSDPRSQSRTERKERIKRNERLQRANEKRARMNAS